MTNPVYKQATTQGVAGVLKRAKMTQAAYYHDVIRGDRCHRNGFKVRENRGNAKELPTRYGIRNLTVVTVMYDTNVYTISRATTPTDGERTQWATLYERELRAAGFRVINKGTYVEVLGQQETTK